MKIIIDIPITIELKRAHDVLDVADWLEENSIEFECSSYDFDIYIKEYIKEQILCTTPEFREDFFDKLNALGINVFLERIGHNEYRMS